MNLFKQLARRHGAQARSRGHILRSFAHKLGLVYFGSVDQHVDEHEVIRGLTISTTHDDNHYAVGAFDGYDLSIVDRSDTIASPQNIPTEHNWVIMQLNLQGEQRLPHLFLMPQGDSAAPFAKFYSAFTQLKSINTLFQGEHTAEFHARYQVLASSSHAPIIEELLNPEVTRVIAARLWPHAIEILDGKLYVYTTEASLSETLLDSCLESAVWLAKVLDQQPDEV